MRTRPMLVGVRFAAGRAILTAWLALTALVAFATICLADPPATGPVLFGAADFKGITKTGSIVGDPNADGGQAFETFAPFHFEAYSSYPAFAPLHPGWYRIDFRLRATTAPGALDGIDMRIWNQPNRPTSFSYNTRFLSQEIKGDSNYSDLTRIVHVGEREDQYGIALNGGWNGLTIESFKMTPITSSLILQSVRPHKLLYGTTEAGTADIAVINPSNSAQRAHLRVAIESGLTQHDVVCDREISVQPGVDASEITVPFPAQSEYGHAIVANLLVGAQSVGVKRDYFYVSDHPVSVGHLGAMSVGGSAYNADEAADFVNRMRAHYFPMYEIDFWAPDDVVRLTPDSAKDKWWSGQTLARTTTESMKKRIALGHEQGMKVLGYVDLRVDFGFRVAEFFRKYPDLCLWDVNNTNPTTVGAGVSEIQQQVREDDSERFDPANPNISKFGARGQWAMATGNPKLVDYHIDQLVSSIKMFDWDGFRYDDRYDYDTPQVDMLGRQLPFPGFTNSVVLARIRSALERQKPGFIYGHNMEWRQNVDPGIPAMPTDTKAFVGDHYTELIRDGGLHLQERYTTHFVDRRTPWTDVVENLNRVGVNAYRWGGAAYNISGANGAKPTDSKYLTALNIAAMNHIAYDVADQDVGYMRLACRYCGLLYGRNIVTPTAPESLLAVDSGSRAIWWKQYVRYREVLPGHRIYYVHLINPPLGQKIGDNNPAPAAQPNIDPDSSAAAVKGMSPATQTPPDPVSNIKLVWSLPPGWKPDAAYVLSGEGGDGLDTSVEKGAWTATTDTVGQDIVQQALPISTASGGCQITVPTLRIWSIVAIDCTGPITDIAPNHVQTLPPLPADWVPTPPRTASYAPSVNGMPPIIVNPNSGQWVDPNSANAKLPLVADTGTQSGSAVRAAGPVKLEAYFGPPGGGAYHVSIRLKTSVAPPPTAQMTFYMRSEQGKPYSWALPIVTQSLADLTPQQGWRTFEKDVVLQGGGTSLGVFFGGGFDGLLIDTLTISELKRWPDSKQITIAGGSNWPVGLGLSPHSGRNVWLGEGFYADNYKLKEAVAKLPGVNVDDAAYWTWTDKRGFGGPMWDTPQKLAAYDLVVLGNIDLHAFSIQQRDWLRNYVDAGGSVLMLGGPYGLGRGYWQESDLVEPIFPVTMHAFDLKPAGVGAPLPLKANAAGLFAGIDVSSMTNLWQHQFDIKPNATVQMTSGGEPAVVTWQYGKGRVAVVGITPLGDDSAVPTTWRQSPGWVNVMAKLSAWLLRE